LSGAEQSGKRIERRIDGSDSARDARDEAEGWDRVYIRSVRALRDLRRHTAAVIVNNQGGQLNVAADQCQQTNVVKKPGKRKATRRGIHAVELSWTLSVPEESLGRISFALREPCAV